MKIKKKYDRFLECDRFSNMTFKEYSDRMNSLTRNQVRNIYKEVFDKECTCNVVWAKYQISYELARQQEIRSKNLERLQPNSAFRKAYDAVMAFDLEHVGETIRTLIPYELKHNNENSEEYLMKKEQKVKAIKKAAEVKAARRVGVTLGKSVIQTWVHIFQTNAKNKWTDERISEFMHAEFPELHNKTFDQVHTIRGYYNGGRYTENKPEVKSVRYDAEGNVIGRASKKAVKAPKAAPVAAKPAKAAKPAAKAKKLSIKPKKA